MRTALESTNVLLIRFPLTRLMQYIAFLRGMNLGKRRITNEDLCAAISGLGFQDVWAFLASGNVVFETTKRSATKVQQELEAGLLKALEYEVPTFLRSAAELREVAAYKPFDSPTGTDGGKLQISFLASAPTPAKRKAALSCATRDDALHIEGREFYWLPKGKLTESELDMKSIDKALGPMTMRTQGTIVRLVKKLDA